MKRRRNHGDRKGKGNRKGKGKGKEESRIVIDDLPDPILQLIVSSLPTKEAVRTGILSKRWANLWMDIPRIKLREGDHQNRQQFIDFVRRLLVVRDCSKLEKLSLCCKVGDDTSLVNEWLHAFINPTIQELTLEFDNVEEPLVFPDHLFTCATLTWFRLSMNRIFDLPSSIHFQSLRKLILKHLILPDGSSTQRLFSSCPSLEDLALMDCDWENVTTDVCISSPMLHTLTITEWDEDWGRNGLKRRKVVIVGNNLKSISLGGDVSNDYYLLNSTSVTDASIELQAPDVWWTDDWKIETGYFIFRLLREIPKVEKLSFSENVLEAISFTLPLLQRLPLLCNLAELHVMGATVPVDLSCEGLMTILQKSHCLREIHFDLGGVSLSKKKEDYILDTLPVCFKKHLKTITICGCSGSKGELNAIRVLLQAASVLETLSISCFSPEFPDFDTPEGSKSLSKMFGKILCFPRGSVDCDIKFDFI